MSEHNRQKTFWESSETINYFALRGMGWGIVLGALSGTLMLPLIGTVLAALWGMVAGTVFGLLTGILVAISDAVFWRKCVERQIYRRRLSAGAGLFTSTGAGIALCIFVVVMLSSGEFEFPVLFFVPTLFLTIVWSGLAAANTSTHHIDGDIDFFLRGGHHETLTIVSRLIRAALRPSTLLVGAVAGSLGHLGGVKALVIFQNLDTELHYVFEGILLGGMIAAVDVLLLSMANGLFLMFINRLYFKEYAPHLTLAQYKTRVSMLAFLFTLVAGLVVSGFVFVPVSAVIAAMAARSYADWLYQGDEKLKRQAKEKYDASARLQDISTEVDEIEEDIEYTEKITGKL